MYSMRLELDSIQSRWREPHFEERNQSRAGDLAAQSRCFGARQALKRHPASLHDWRSLPLQERILLVTSSAGAVDVDEDYLD